MVDDSLFAAMTSVVIMLSAAIIVMGRRLDALKRLSNKQK
jgi:hypothetical protein